MPLLAINDLSRSNLPGLRQQLPISSTQPSQSGRCVRSLWASVHSDNIPDPTYTSRTGLDGEKFVDLTEVRSTG